ncbi:porin [Enterobacteriaceae endosymbiont of Donacia versicolorea]|uniref:porin n=1 Tax=Enterobacteriaceae endosymbiont of Donacia versicolorea TaxID=2675788 RepID=UPI001449945E|nr:porin [Enterobacteriaceae endosymbiont of Donacia versicolorea]QJC32144.1 porin [Enterobacteriaceae endosymbiont of Donacia versicolorea]
MKFNIFKILILFLLSINFVNASEIYDNNGQKIDLYGILEIKNTVSKNNIKIPQQYRDTESNIILGLKGVTNIYNDIYSYAQIEYSLPIHQVEINKDIYPSIRLGFIGVKFNHGNSSIDYGRNYGILYDVTSYMKKNSFFEKNFMYDKNDYFMFGRTNNLLTYRNKNFFGLIKGLNIALQYKNSDQNYDDNENSLENSLENSKQGWGTSINYKIGNTGVSISGAYFNVLKTIDKDKKIFSNTKKIFDNKNINTYSIGAKYQKNNIYLAAVLSSSYNGLKYTNFNSNDNGHLFAHKITNLEIIGQYKFDDNLKTTISYTQSQGYDIPAGYHYLGGNIDLSKYILINTMYKFNKNFSAYIGYRISLLSNNNDYIKNNRIFNGNILGIGITYNF